jgi:streptogramin lyase
MEFPISGSESLILEMERLNIIAPHCRYKIGSSAGDVETDPPDVVLYRGYVRDEPSSYAYLAFTGQGSGNGYVRTGNGELYMMSHPASEIGKPDGMGIIIHKATTFGDLPEFEEFCRVIDEYTDLPQMGEVRFFADTLGGPRIIGMAIEGDQRFCQIFPDVTAAQNYVVQLIGAVSDIYLRDFNAKVVLSFLRLWPEGGAPFSGYNLYGLRSYWQSNEDLTGINVVQLLSGIRDLDYGGIGFVGGYCSGTFSISGYINGSFPTPVGLSNISAWDLIVSAHEMGHNMATYHTHDGFDPPIDSCGSLGIRARSTIMSYCHTTPGYTSNIELRFHRLVQQVVEYYMVYFDCLDFDCNNNGADDAQDIALGISQDVNSNGIPDECEDCNDNGTLDNIDIAGGAPDVNNNGIPDECETDCNGNSIPDNYETNLGMASDLNGNCVPDECDPDCNDNSLPDFWEIKYGYEEDWDNNGIPDVCQDCDENGVADMYDLGKQFNLYVADGSGFIREYNAISGVPVQNMGSGSISSPTDCTFGPDRQLYVSTGNGIDRINVDSATTTTFITSGSGGLITPTFLTFGPNDNLFVSSYGTHCVLEFDGPTGAFVDTFVTPNSGGLVAPWGLEFGPNGNLFVAGANNTVYEYSGTDGSFIGIFVTSGSGGLTSPRGIAFAPDGHLLVASQSTSQVLKYDGTTGAFLGVFHDEYNPIYPHGVRIGPNGNVYVVQSYSPSNVFEFVYPEGRYYRRFGRGRQLCDRRLRPMPRLRRRRLRRSRPAGKHLPAGQLSERLQSRPA